MPAFLLGNRKYGHIQTDIEQQLAVSEPQVEVLLAEVLGGQKVRLFSITGWRHA